jgi:hypothetical protein
MARPFRIGVTGGPSCSCNPDQSPSFETGRAVPVTVLSNLLRASAEAVDPQDSVIVVGHLKRWRLTPCALTVCDASSPDCIADEDHEKDHGNQQRCGSGPIRNACAQREDDCCQKQGRPAWALVCSPKIGPEPHIAVVGVKPATAAPLHTELIGNGVRALKLAGACPQSAGQWHLDNRRRSGELGHP